MNQRKAQLHGQMDLAFKLPTKILVSKGELTLPYDVEVTVKSVKGTCDFGCKVGDKVYFDGRKIKGDICYSVLMAIFPKVYAMRYGAEFPWAKNRDIIHNVCPDPENPVVFEIKRIRK